MKNVFKKRKLRMRYYILVIFTGISTILINIWVYQLDNIICSVSSGGLCENLLTFSIIKVFANILIILFVFMLLYIYVFNMKDDSGSIDDSNNKILNNYYRLFKKSMDKNQ